MKEDVPEYKKSNGAESRPHRKHVQQAGRAWFWALKASWGQVLQVNRSNLTAFQALRAAFGVVLPLALGVATGLTITGAAIASGALMLGAIGLRDPARTRGRAMLLASLFITLSALVGGLIGSFGWLPVLVIGLWGFAAGLAASNSQAAQVVGIQSCAALIVYTHFGLDPAHALLAAGLVGSGALLQTLLTVLPSPWTNTIPERSALAVIYQKLADYATSPDSAHDALLLTDVLLAARTTFLDSNMRTQKGRMFARLLEKAEHLRLTLLLLLSEYQRIREEEPTSTTGCISEYLEQILRASGEELQAVAHTLKAAPSGAESSATRPSETLKQALVKLRWMARGSYEETLQRVLPYCMALRGELYSAGQLATSLRQVRQTWQAHLRFSYPRPPGLHLEDTWSNLRANLTLHSSACRHAIRLGVTLALGTVLYQVVPLPVQRGYWIPMTAAFVLRSDFITTFTRGFARMLGTMLGAVLTTLLLVFLSPANPLLVLLTALTAYLMFAMLFVNYTIFSVATTMVAVFLLSFTHTSTLETVVSRAIDTALGGLLALLVYALWPTWERAQVPEYIAQRLEALGHFLNAVLQEYARSDMAHTHVFEKRHMASRLARSNAMGSVQRSLQEPEIHRVNADLAEGVLGAADNIARSVLALEAYLLDHPHHDTLPEIAHFSSTIERALHDLAMAVRAGQPAPEPPDLQAARHKVKSASKSKKLAQDITREQWQFVETEIKQIATNTQLLYQLLSTGTFA